MILLLDIGNSTLKWAGWADGELLAGGRVPLGDGKPAELAREQWSGLEPPRRVVAASVAGERVDAPLAEWTGETWGLVPEFVVPRAEACGVINGYVEPAKLGVDRWTALLGARSLTTGAACIVDCGTAITVDVLAPDGAHLGGLIVPGLGLMGRALEQNTAVRADGECARDVDLLARDTAGAVTGGVLYAAVAFIDRVVADTAAAMGVQPERLITGGDAPRVLPLLSGRFRHLPDLVLQGLAVLLEECP